MKKHKRIINDLLKRHDEVMKRINSPVPVKFLRRDKFKEYKWWLVSPLFVKEYKPYDPKEEISAIRQKKMETTTMKIINSSEDNEETKKEDA